jgi:S1-C subfamily serine protease
VCHAGLISSIYPSGPTQILQIDGSVNASNSGGPLIDAETGDVLGIVTRKATGLSRMFQELLQSFENNIQVMQASQGMVGLAGVDPIAALIASQRQLQHVAREIERSANVGIGYAFSAEHIATEGALQYA